MAPTRLLLLAALAGAASATLVCPTSSQDPNSACLCTSGCSINGDTTFPWSLPAYPPPALPMGMDTICATIIVPCTPAFATVNAVLGVTGNVQMDANATNDVSLCSANTQVVMHTSFTAAECATFATAFNAAAASSAAYVTPMLCTTHDCNSVGALTMASPAPRLAAAAGALAAAAAAALLL